MGVTPIPPNLAPFYPLYAPLLHRFTSITPQLFHTNDPTLSELFEKLFEKIIQTIKNRLA